MASIQNEDGHIKIPTHLLDALCQTRIPGEARQALDFIFRKTYGSGRCSGAIPLSQFMAAIGISRSHVVRAIKTIESMNLISTERKSKAFNRSMGSHDTGTTVVPKKGNAATIYKVNEDIESWVVPKKGQRVVPNSGYTKDKYGARKSNAATVSPEAQEATKPPKLRKISIKTAQKKKINSPSNHATRIETQPGLPGF